MTLSRAAASELLSQHGLTPKRSLGQNFVVDPNTVRRIAHMADIGPNDRVVEIGAGLGSLTAALAATGASVLAVEIDQRLLPILRETVAPYPNVTVMHGDAREIDWDNALRDDGPWSLVANLPYNIATPLVIGLLDDVPQVQRMLVMVQKEV